MRFLMRASFVAQVSCTAVLSSAVTALAAQTPVPPSQAVAPGSAQLPIAAQQPASPSVGRIILTAGRSTVLTTDFDIARIAVNNPAVADAVVVLPREILIDGKSAGTVSLIVWGASERRQYDVVVDAGITPLEQRLQALFPGEDIHVSVNDEAIILSGRVSSNGVSLRAAEIAEATSSKAKVVNLLQLPGGSDSQQVLLQVRFAEVNRRAVKELGATLFTGPNGEGNWVGRSTTQQFPAPAFTNRLGPPPATNPTDEGKLAFSDFLNLFLFNSKYDVGAVIRALKEKGLFQSLAEPNLIAYQGQEASFLAGGEVPIPVVQAGSTNAVTIVFKEYGIRLNFRPTIAGDTIRLKVRPEVSTLDFANGIVLSGFRVPALLTRRAETDVELRDGQSFAIAGMLDNLSQDDLQVIPGLAKIPIIGYLFKSRAMQAERTELMVLITPTLVRPLNPDEVPPLPTFQKRFLSDGEELGGELQGGGGVEDGPEVSSPKDSASGKKPK
jgi:pilus assembly protein CpaC